MSNTDSLPELQGNVDQGIGNGSPASLDQSSLNAMLMRFDPGPVEETQPSAPSWLPMRPEAYLEIPLRHWRAIAICMALSLLVGWAMILALPRAYESEAKLKIRVGRESVALDPTVTTGETMLLQQTREEEVMSTLEVLGSRQVATRVVEKIGAEAILDGYVPENSPPKTPSLFAKLRSTASEAVNALLNSAGLKDDISDHELAVRELSEVVTIVAPKKSDVITVQAYAKSAEMAQLQVQATLDAFLEEHQKVSATPGSLGFFDRQRESAEQSLNAAVTSRRDFLQKHGLVSIESSRVVLEDKLVMLNRELGEAQNRLDQSEAETQILQESIDSMEDESVVSKLSGASATWSGIRQRIYDLELEEKQLDSLYTDFHPVLVSVREQLAGARKIFEDFKAEDIQASTAPNPQKMDAITQLRKTKTTIAGLRHSIAEKKLRSIALKDEITAVTNHERELSEIDRQIGVMETKYGELTQKQEEARLIDDMMREKLSNVSIFQPALFIERPVSPNKKVLAAFFVLFGGFSGFALAFVREAKSGIVRRADQLQHWVGDDLAYEVPYGRMGPRNHEMVHACSELISSALFSYQPSNQTSRSPIFIGVWGIQQGCGASTVAAMLQRVAEEQRGRNARVESCKDFGEVFDIRERTAGCDLVIFDLATAEDLQDLEIIQQLDHLIVVVESEVTPISKANRLLKYIRQLPSPNLLGVVVNKTRFNLRVPGIDLQSKTQRVLQQRVAQRISVGPTTPSSS